MAERRRRPDRRQGDRRSTAGRRSSDYRSGFSPVAAFFGICGALVVLYLFFVAFGGVDPSEDPAWGIAALVLALLWLAYSWKRLWGGGASPPADRERRGF
jgi:type VI protein secretion system component VasF